jgi:hypothetical protein
VRGNWTTITGTIPDTYPGGLQKLGIQFGTNSTFAGGDIYIDAVTSPGVLPNCVPAATGGYDFETGLDGWTSTVATIAQSSDQFVTGASSLMVSISALAPGADLMVLAGPGPNCGNAVTLNVWTPADSADLWFKAFSQINGWIWNDTNGYPTTVTRGGWTQWTYTLPAEIYGGVQSFGVQFGVLSTAAAAYTGNVYVDAVAW